MAAAKAVFDLERQFSRLEKGRREVLLELANNYTEEEDSFLMAIFRTNGMLIGGDKSCVFPTICR